MIRQSRSGSVALWAVVASVVLAVPRQVDAQFGVRPTPQGKTLSLEGESLVATARSGQGRIFAQPMGAFGRGWSGHAQLAWPAVGVGARLEVTVSVATAGEYALAGAFTKAPNCGEFQVGANGTQAGRFQGYDPAVINSGRVALGNVPLNAGNNQIIFVITGKHPRSVGFVIGIDRLELTLIESKSTSTQGTGIVPGRGTLVIPESNNPSVAIPSVVIPEKEPPRVSPGGRFSAGPRLDAVGPLKSPSVAIVEAFDQQLAKQRHGAGWQQYLEIGELIRLLALDPNRLAAADRAKLKSVQARFDEVSREARFKGLAEQPAFQRAHLSLQHQLANMDNLIAIKVPPRGPPEAPKPAEDTFTLLYKKDGEFQNVHAQTIPKTGDQKLTLYWDARKAPESTGVVWQVARDALPTSTDLTPAGLVKSGQGGGQQGLFSVDFGSLIAYPPEGKPFLVRVLPVRLTKPSPTVVGSPSNVMEVYYHAEPPGPAPDLKLPRDMTVPITDGAGEGAPAHCVISLDYLQCNNSNESSDEPYLLVTGFSSKKGSWNPPQPIPLFSGVKGTRGTWGPILINPWGRNEQLDSVAPDEKIGFSVVLMEHDNSNPEQARKVWAALGGMGAGAVAGFFSGGDWEAMESARQKIGKHVGDAVAKLLQTIDPDDKIGHDTVVFSYDQLIERQASVAESQLAEVTRGIPEGSTLSRPWMHPQYQEYQPWGGEMKFTGSGAEYILDYTVFVKNPGYVGPYKW